jgi:Tfp pilus assembly protein PilF
MSDTTAPTNPQAETVDQALARALNAAKLRRIHEAMGICRDLLAKQPDLAGALGLLGGILGQEGRTDEAIEYLKAALAKQPHVANWHLNLCALYRGKNMLDEALASGLEAIRTSPDTAAHRVELALTHLTRGERDLASLRYREALGREPESPAAHMGLGELLLSIGEYAPGWMEYSWRNKLDQARGTLPKMTAAQWNGMNLPGGTLLLVADQGFGDMIQFARYIPWAKQRVPRLAIGWGPEVTALLGHHPDIDICFSRWQDAPPHDAYVLLSSLPEIFGTQLDTIPTPIPYITVNPDRVAHWDARLAQLRPQRRLRVGLAWSGRATHPNNLRRSIRMAGLASVLATPGVDFFGLQKPFPDEDRAFAAAHPHFTDLSLELGDFAETGAVMQNLDLIIAVDTAVVHLAGALGREAWVLVPEPADWRWLLNRTDSPWYPTLRLFRQQKAAEWAPVMADVARSLAEKVGALRSAAAD